MNYRNTKKYEYAKKNDVCESKIWFNKRIFWFLINLKYFINWLNKKGKYNIDNDNYNIIENIEFYFDKGRNVAVFYLKKKYLNLFLLHLIY